MSDDDRRLVGRVARAHGNRGEVIVNLETDFAEARYCEGAVLLVGEGSAARPRRIEAVRFHQGRPVVAFEGVSSMTEAEALAGAPVWMRDADAGPLPEGTYYRHDLIGCEVRDEAGISIGRVTRVEGPLERSLLVVGGARGEVLVPLAAEICRSVDLEGRIIVIAPPDGLIELNDTKRSRA